MFIPRLNIVADHFKGFDFRSDANQVVGTGRSRGVTAELFEWKDSAGVEELTDVGLGHFTGEKYVEMLEITLPFVTVILNPESENSPIHTYQAVKG